jgi:hypothetical protein
VERERERGREMIQWQETERKTRTETETDTGWHRKKRERERESMTGQWHLLLTVDVTVCQEVIVGIEWTVREWKRDSRETRQWSW